VLCALGRTGTLEDKDRFSTGALLPKTDCLGSNEGESSCRGQRIEDCLMELLWKRRIPRNLGGRQVSTPE
jgi:hypothetical protein